MTGLQDITAHVDFTEVAEAAAETGFELLGFTHQAAFLLSLGLLDFLQTHQQTDGTIPPALAQQVKILTLPSEMGELFKVMALGKKFDEALCGFKMQGGVFL